MPFLQRPSLSTDLLKEVGVAEEMHAFIQKAIPDAFVGDTDQKILIAALFSLVRTATNRLLLPRSLDSRLRKIRDRIEN